MFMRAVVNETICPNERKSFNISTISGSRSQFPPLSHYIFTLSETLFDTRGINNDESKWKRENNLAIANT